MDSDDEGSAAPPQGANARSKADGRPRGPKLVPGWTPDGPKLFPEQSIRKESDVLAALARLSESKQPSEAKPPASRDAIETDVLKALESMATVDTPLALRDGPRKPIVKEFTQINHVAERGARRTNTAKNPALQAYQRRLVADPCAPVGGAYELDLGTIRPEERRNNKQGGAAAAGSAKPH